MLQLGDTFLLRPVGNPKEHLWIVITERDPKTHEAVCVNISSTKTYTPQSDKTLELKPGVHPKITQPSVVYYKDARVLHLDEVDKALAAEKQEVVCVQCASCTPGLLKRIQDAMPNSGAKPAIKDRCKAAWEAKPVK